MLNRYALQGPGLVARIKSELLACLVRDGFTKLGDAIGRPLAG